MQALCSYCKAMVSAQYVWRESTLLLEKECAAHGIHAARVATERAYWAEVERTAAEAGAVLVRRPPLMCFVEVIDECDLECTTCIAGSLRGAGNPRDPRALVDRVSALAGLYGRLDLIMLTGGEPTLHSNLPRIAADLAPFAKQIVLITNGLRISSDIGYVRELREANPRLHVYLQFDSLRPEVLLHLRGADLSRSRLQAVENLGLEALTATLVSVVKSGVNDQHLHEVANYGLEHDHVLGATFQPVRAAGRHTSFAYADHHITLCEVRRSLIRALDLSEDCIRPHPSDPHRVAIGYLDRSSRASWTDEVLSRSPAEGLLPLYLTAEEHAAHFYPRNMFRLAVISYYDQHDIVLDAGRADGMVFLTDGGGLVSLEDRFLFQQSEVSFVPHPTQRSST